MPVDFRVEVSRSFDAKGDVACVTTPVDEREDPGPVELHELLRSHDPFANRPQSAPPLKR